MRRLAFFAALLALAVVVGCEKPLPAPAGAIPIDLTDAGADTLEAALKEREGKVVLVDFWATWCPPCRARFPHFVETHKKYADKGLVCFSVSMDRFGPKTDRPEVLAFLKEKEATFPNFLFSDSAKDGQYIERRFGFEGSLPFMALFGKNGKKVWDSEQKSLSDRELDKLIESELAK